MNKEKATAGSREPGTLEFKRGGRSRAMMMAKALAAGGAWAVLLFLALDAWFPLPPLDRPGQYATVVTAADGTPLRGFADEEGVWRYPVRIEEVSPRYLTALIQYEDRWFWHHPGVNPLALVRAVKDWARHGRIVSGGSTLTMQTARILCPVERSIWGKMVQMFRALQLEVHHTKKEILTCYLNHAPFGGPIEGVQAASYAYLGKSAMDLSRAEAALLAVLPQAPTRLRPDRHPERAEKARDKVLDRMVRFGVWSKQEVREAKIERVAARFDPRPMSAPLLARRLKDQARGGQAVRTTIDLFFQETAVDLVQRHVQGLPPRTSAAALIVDNRTLGVLAYVGSADFLDEDRFGHVDIIRAHRSPGSTLKPFLYGVAIEEGLIHSESLLVDAPLSFSGYRPTNFTDGFAGPVSAREALVRSLNIPAVDLLDRLGTDLFDARLRQGGLNLKYPPHVRPNLSLILGGVGVRLEDLVSAYTALARDGLAGRLRYTREAPLKERRLLTPGAAFIIRTILAEQKRPDLPGGRLSLDRSRQVAWKTGTSYGYRDAWSIGVTDDYTIGVWVGRPDGTPSPGQYGRASAAPLLFALVDSLPRQSGAPPAPPSGVRTEIICWPLGSRPQGPDDPLCHERREALILNGTIPPTLPDRLEDRFLPNPVTVLTDSDTGLRVDVTCSDRPQKALSIARWPKAAEPWLSPRLRKVSRIPSFSPDCRPLETPSTDTVKILGIEDQTVFRPQGADRQLPEVTLAALGGRGRLYWMINDELVAEALVGETRFFRFSRPGRYQLTVMDQAGHFDLVNLEVMAANR